MFDRIAGRYDLLNRLLSLRIDTLWRKRLLRYVPADRPITALDAATGTADVLLTVAKKRNLALGIGIDPSRGMLALGREKIAKSGLNHTLSLLPGDARHLPLANTSVDLVTIAFGIRNVPDVELALADMHRVLKNSGRLLVLEFSMPDNKIVRNIYLLYFRFILPKIGGWLSGDRNAYAYLNQTVENFPYGPAFKALLMQAGFRRVDVQPLTFGIATLYIAERCRGLIVPRSGH